MSQGYADVPVIVAARYHRISADKAGDEHGVENQQTLTAKLAAERGYVLTSAHGPDDEPGVFTDNDVSAYKNKHRPGYEALLAAAQRGDFNVIVVRHLDRLWANRVALARGMEILGKAGVSVACVKGQDIDLSNAQGQLMCDILGAVGQYERAIKGERGVGGQREAAAKGLHLGGPRPFGWNLVADPARADSLNRAYAMANVSPVVNAGEAREIIRCAHAVLAGRSLRSLAGELNAAGYSPPARKGRKRQGTEGKWDTGNLRTVLLRERNFGTVIFNEERFDGVWPALTFTDDSGEHVFDEALHRKVTAKLTAPERLTRPDPAPTARFLLSGIARCGVCGEPVRAGGRRGYKDDHVSRSTEAADHVVSEWLIGRLEAMPIEDRARLLGSDEPSGPDADEAARLRAKIATVQDGLLDGTFTKAEATGRIKALRASLTAAERRMARVTRKPVIAALLTAQDPRKAWAALPLDRKRAVLRELAVITILPSARGKTLSKYGSWTSPEAIGITVEWNVWASVALSVKPGEIPPAVVNVTDTEWKPGD
jgi:DNA invertase Pin-like site-specific DNA recombinase